MKNKLKTTIREAKLDHLGSLLSRGRSVPSQAAEVWSYVNNMFGMNKCRQSPQPEIGSLNSINNHFQNVAIASHLQSLNPENLLILMDCQLDSLRKFPLRLLLH